MTEVTPSDELNFDSLCDTHRRILRDLNKKINNLKDDRSSVSSKRSRRSGKSRRSFGTTSSAALLKTEMMVKAARLETELKFHEIEREKLADLKRHEDELKKLQMMKELAATQAEIEAVGQVENCSNSGLNIDNVSKLVAEGDSQERVEQYVQSQQAHNPHKGLLSVDEEISQSVIDPNGASQQNSAEQLVRVQNFHPSAMSKECISKNVSSRGGTPSAVKVSTHEDPITRLADLLTERQDHDKLPRPQPEVFSGDFLQYPIWIKAFETFIEGKTKLSSERLYYLSKFTSGEAKEAISGLLSLDSEKAYVKAKKILTDRFGNAFLVSNAYRKKIENWPKIPPNDGPGLRRFSDFLQHCRTAMDSIQYLNVLNDPEENRKFLNKLPAHLVNRWVRVVDRRIADDLSDDGDEDRVSRVASGSGYPTFAEFCKFLKKEARIACNPVNFQRLPKKEEPNKMHKAKVFAVNSVASQTMNVPDSETKIIKKISCIFCKEAHELDLCEKFLKIPLVKKREVIVTNRLCWGCLRWGHINSKCRRKRVCRTCNGLHPTALHGDKREEKVKATPSTPKVAESEKVKSNQERTISNRVEVHRTSVCTRSLCHSLIVPVWLHHQINPKRRVMVYALLDEQSDTCFIKDSILNVLEVDGPEVPLELSTVLSHEVIKCQKITGLVCRGINETVEVSLPRTYTRSQIPARSEQIPRPESARMWPHLEKIAEKIMPYRSDVAVGLLIGTSCIRAIKPREIITGNDDDPYAKKTILGWGIVGTVEPGENKDVEDSQAMVNRTLCGEIQVGKDRKVCHFAFKTQTKEILSANQVNKMFELDFSDREKGKSLSYEDRLFIKKIEEGIHQRVDGHYEMPLPFKDENIKLPDNRKQALARLQKLKQRLKNDKKYHLDYSKFVSDTIDNGYAERVPEGELSLKDGRVWYLSHHGVYNSKKPDKIRVVFDCSAVYERESLNRNLLQGPDLTNNLLGILCRFRQDSTALMCDLEAMFHQVKVNVEDRNFLRFLWWKDGNLDAEPVEYRMSSHLFGATSSPGCANVGLRKTADDYEKICGTEAADFVRNNFYVDDGLKSVPSPSDAISLIESTETLCKKGGFRLHKIISNSQRVIDTIPPEDRAKGIKDLVPSRDALPIERALGVQWCVESDTFQFRIELSDRPLTRRGVLATVSSVFDPLGVLSPFILLGKRILQQLCREAKEWDEKVPEYLVPEWERWRKDICLLAQLKIPRCYKPDGFGEIDVVELHNFSDASEEGYGQCSYLRLIDHTGRIHCSLVMAKSRVAPLKSVTIPRLELTAALVNAKVGTSLRRELDYNEINEIFWTDSRVVLGYIFNNVRRFHVFVSNRVQQIRDLTSIDQWRYIPTKSNPADFASRGLDAQRLLDKREWWFGPDFLWSNFDPDYGRIDEDNNIAAVCPDDPEVRKCSVMVTRTEEHAGIEERLNRYSSWFEAKRAIAICLRFKEILLARLRKRKLSGEQSSDSSEGSSRVISCNPVNVDELNEAGKEIIRIVQRKSFIKETLLLHQRNVEESSPNVERGNKESHGVPKSSSLFRLDPILTKDGVLRVGGRIRRANMPLDVKHPCILPKKGHVTELIICHFHKKVAHQGRGMTHNSIRSSGFWIIGGVSPVSNHISKCVKCRKVRGELQKQRMADLPEDRLEPSPPFTYSAVDYFGPWLVKEGRRNVKRYGVLFTCLVSRAIHLETAISLDTSSFLNAYRRFVGRRGPVRQLRSDRGTNFVGCRTELQAALSEMNQETVRQKLLKENCDLIKFQMNVPHASHMGGSWERQIRSVRNVLSALLDAHGEQLDDESLRTFMVEAEAIINSRPLSLNFASQLEPLTPNHLLTMKSNIILPPPGEFQRADVYSKKRWRRVQYLINEFWSRWKKEFLQSLQTRQKWVRPQKNLKKGDIVVVNDEDLPRNQWKLARVAETFPSDDNLVRKVKLAMADSTLDSRGRRKRPISYLDRPVHKLVLLLSNEEFEDQGFPDEGANDDNDK